MLVVVWIIPRIVVSNGMPSHGCENGKDVDGVCCVGADGGNISILSLEHLPSVEVR